MATSLLTTIPVGGRFSLREVATMGFGHRHEDSFDGVMRLAFCLDGDGYQHQGAAVVSQDSDGGGGQRRGRRVAAIGRGAEVSQDSDGVRCRVVAGDPATVVAQVARVLSLDHDGAVFDEIGRRDPVIARLQEVAPGLRPPLFYSPYEAAAWAVLSARRSGRQMAEVRRRLSVAHGTVFDLAGTPTAAFPAPAQLLAVRSFPGLNELKIARLHGIARAASDGWLDASSLKAIGPEEASAKLQTLPGIGPFYASLVVVRATGFADVLPVDEPKLLAAVGDLYHLGHPASAEELTRIAEAWRPRRTWAAVLVRAAYGRLSLAGPVS
jgi:DNA-3-methyladenine glycosylase II